MRRGRKHLVSLGYSEYIKGLLGLETVLQVMHTKSLSLHTEDPGDSVDISWLTLLAIHWPLQKWEVGGKPPLSLSSNQGFIPLN